MDMQTKPAIHPVMPRPPARDRPSPVTSVRGDDGLSQRLTLLLNRVAGVLAEASSGYYPLLGLSIPAARAVIMLTVRTGFRHMASKLAVTALLATLMAAAGANASTTYYLTFVPVFGSFPGGGTLVVETNGPPAQGEYGASTGLTALTIQNQKADFTLADDPAAIAVFDRGKLVSLKFSAQVGSGSAQSVLRTFPADTFLFNQGIGITAGYIMTSSRPGSGLLSAFVLEAIILALFTAFLCGLRAVLRRRGPPLKPSAAAG